MTRSQHREFLFFLNFSTSHTHPKTDVLLNSGILPPAKLQALIFLHRQSFVMIPVAPCAPTPPPAPSEIPQEGPWIITPNDITTPPEGPWSPDDVPQPSTSKVHNTPDYGMPFHLSWSYFIEVGIGNVTWLFQDDFCNFASVHLGFNVSIQFTQVSLGKHVICTVCPNWFCGKDGPTPPGSVAVMVTGHNKGLGIQHLMIPSCFLTPANPARKNHLCLVLKGAKAGRVMQIRECRKKTAQVVTEEGNIYPFSDICAAFEM